MRKAKNRQDFLSKPGGSYLVGKTFLYFFPSPKLSGFLLWGHPAESDIDELFQVVDGALEKKRMPFLSLIDASRLEEIGRSAFLKVLDLLSNRMARYSSLVRKQALLRPAGLPGAVVAGFYKLIEPRYPVEVFTDLPSALDWLGREGEDDCSLDLVALWNQAVGRTPSIRKVRELIEADLVGSTLGRVARQMGLSERTLQRQLHDAGTNFQGELHSARIRAAQDRMLETDEKLTAIAFEVGCSSLQHFSALFRKATGQTPSSWRTARLG